MRLYLSSQRIGDDPQVLVDLFRGRTRIALVANAAYLDDLAKQRDRVESELKDLQGLGFQAAEIDLRDYFGHQNELRPVLEAFDGLWVLGGNVIVLRTAFSASGADQIVRARLGEDSLAYAGYSAGACLLGPLCRSGTNCSCGDFPDIPPTSSQPAWTWCRSASRRTTARNQAPPGRPD